jgi:hypothetical protein
MRGGKVGGSADYLSPSDAMLIELAASRVRL